MLDHIRITRRHQHEGLEAAKDMTIPFHRPTEDDFAERLARAIPDRRRRMVASLLSAGWKARAIAKIMGISESRVSQIVRELAVERLP
jgi:DNA-directed RNA polymerase specialized sigma subunit